MSRCEFRRRRCVIRSSRRCRTGPVRWKSVSVRRESTLSRRRRRCRSLWSIAKRGTNMSGFTPSVRAIFEFEGDTVEVVLKRLKRKDFQKWAQHIVTEGDTVKLTFASQLEMGNVLYD